MEASIVALEVIIKIDPSIKELADLDYGWYARRGTKDSHWNGTKIELQYIDR
jgi:hypothetical protein